jgi:acyl dehydratase
MPLRAKVDGPVMAFEKLEVGDVLPEMNVVYDEDMQGRFLAALQEDNPWYYKESPWGGPLTYHPLLDDAPMEAAMHRYQYPFSFVHARQETEFINPLPLGKPVRIISKIVDKYIKRNRGYIVIESLVVDEEGLEIIRARNHAMIDDERVREAAKSGLLHVPVSRSSQQGKKEKNKP